MNWDRLTRSWWTSALLGCLAFGVYVANGHDIGTDDTLPACLIPHTLARGEGVRLDYFRPVLDAGGGEFFGCVTMRRGHIVSRHPVAAGILAAPLVWAQYPIYDRIHPIWSTQPTFRWRFGIDMAKHAAAFIAACVVTLSHRLLCQLGLAGVSIPATLALAFGSPLWTISSQSLWQHGPAALALTGSLLCMGVERPGRSRFVGAGLCIGFMVSARLVSAPLALWFTAWVVRYHRGRLIWYLPGLLAFSIALVAYNLYWFGGLLGGQAELEAVHPAVHAVDQAWTLNPLPGLLGTLFSPSRGLFVFVPWVALSLACAPWSTRRLAAFPLVGWMLWGLIPYLLMLSCYTVWWGGFCFGPRYWADVAPLFAVLLACALSFLGGRRPVGTVVFGIAIAWSIALQALGAACYPSSWNLSPRSVDLDHSRLWDWGDCEVTRCLNEKLFAKK